MVYFTKNSTKKSGKKKLFCNTLHAKTLKAAGLIFAVSIPITIMELFKKTADQYLLLRPEIWRFLKTYFSATAL
jgi:hypothetical protein